MRGCISGQTAHVLIGLHRVGLVGLREALKKAGSSELFEREPIVDFLMEALAPDNYMPPADSEPYRKAIWREYVRLKGGDISELFSEVDVVVRGESGEKLDGFVATLNAVFGDYELKPVIQFEPPADEGAHPQLLLEKLAVVKGSPPKKIFKDLVRKYISDW